MKAPFSRCKLALTPHDHSGAQSLQAQPKFYGHHFKGYKTHEKRMLLEQRVLAFFSSFVDLCYFCRKVERPEDLILLMYFGMRRAMINFVFVIIIFLTHVIKYL